MLVLLKLLYCLGTFCVLTRPGFIFLPVKGWVNTSDAIETALLLDNIDAKIESNESSRCKLEPVFAEFQPVSLNFLGTAGFAFLPFLWCVNAVWFFSEAFRKPPYEEQADIKKYVIMSGIGAVVWLTALTAWIVVFQLHRAEWGEIADRMSFIIPTGIP